MLGAGWPLGVRLQIHRFERRRVRTASRSCRCAGARVLMAMTLYDLKRPDWSVSADRGVAPDRSGMGNELGRRGAGLGSHRPALRTATLGLTPEDSHWLHSVLTHWPGRLRGARPLAGSGASSVVRQSPVRVIRSECAHRPASSRQGWRPPHAVVAEFSPRFMAARGRSLSHHGAWRDATERARDGSGRSRRSRVIAVNTRAAAHRDLGLRWNDEIGV